MLRFKSILIESILQEYAINRVNVVRKERNGVQCKADEKKNRFYCLIVVKTIYIVLRMRNLFICLFRSFLFSKRHTMRKLYTRMRKKFYVTT